MIILIQVGVKSITRAQAVTYTTPINHNYNEKTSGRRALPGPHGGVIMVLEHSTDSGLAGNGGIVYLRVNKVNCHQ
jgi:hypothetical protein